MNIYAASFVFRKSNQFSIKRFNDGWVLMADDEVIHTQRGDIKVYKTIEAILKDLEKITRKPVNQISMTISNESQQNLSI